MDDFIAELKAHHDLVKEEEDRYRNGAWPLGMLAHRLGLDTIDVAAGLVSHGIPLKVALGNESERKAAAHAVRENERKGCALDFLSFWTAWRLKALDAVASTCGPIHLTQSIVDRLRERSAKFEFFIRDGLRTARYADGKVALDEATPEGVRQWRDDVNLAIAWAEANATICPLLVSDDLPPMLRDLLRRGGTDIFDVVVLSMNRSILLVTDDLWTRELNRLVGGGGSTWLHQLFSVALEEKRVDLDTFIRWAAHLVNSGHAYIGSTGGAVARSARMDAEEGGAPGYLFTTLTKVFGGKNADPVSHVGACLGCLHEIWTDPGATAYREACTGLLLRRLTQDRHGDYAAMLRAVLHNVQDMPQLVDYMYAWTRGHFLPLATLR
jgi:hypothetical protein